MTWIPIAWRYGKLIGVFLLVGAIIWIYKDWRFQIKENQRLEKNYTNEVKKDSTGYSEQKLTKEQAEEKIYYTDPYLAKLLKEQNIKIKNLERVVTTQNEFFRMDTTRHVLNEILLGIRENRSAKQRVISQDSCYLVGANIHFNGQDVYLDSLEVKFMTRTDIIASLPKKKWWLPWKWFKKRKATITVVDKCGESKTEIVDLVKS